MKYNKVHNKLKVSNSYIDFIRTKLAKVDIGEFIFHKNRLDYDCGTEVVTSSGYYIRIFPRYTWIAEGRSLSIS